MCFKILKLNINIGYRRTFSDTVSSETAEAVNAVLRTPGTRARAAAAADGRLVLDTTPETVAERMQPPQSILKSNKRLVG